MGVTGLQQSDWRHSQRDGQRSFRAVWPDLQCEQEPGIGGQDLDGGGQELNGGGQGGSSSGDGNPPSSGIHCLHLPSLSGVAQNLKFSCC